jgi:hypothetical protein
MQIGPKLPLFPPHGCAWGKRLFGWGNDLDQVIWPARRPDERHVKVADSFVLVRQDIPVNIARHLGWKVVVNTSRPGRIYSEGSLDSIQWARGNPQVIETR